MSADENRKSTLQSVEEQIQLYSIPEHVAFIMDGNGRWAKKRYLPRSAGHAQGMKRVRDIVKVANRIGIKHLTFFAFSTENWRRPHDEVNYLMKMPFRFLKTDLPALNQQNVRIKWFGERHHIPIQTQMVLDEFEEKTKKNTGLQLHFAVNYGSRHELIEAIKCMISDIENGKIEKRVINEALVNQYLYTRGMPDPDIVIRTSGEMRLSNFLLWQLAYTELFFVEENWPDFTPKLFLQVIHDFQKRSRRFGSL